MTEQSTDLTACYHEAKSAAKLAAAWAEAADLFSHHAAVARRFAREARQAASWAQTAAKVAADLAPNPAHATSEKALHALDMAQRVCAYAAQAEQSVIHAAASVKAARRFVPQRGDLADLCRTQREAVFAWVSCPEGEVVNLAVLRARMEEAQAAVQVILPVPATA